MNRLSPVRSLGRRCVCLVLALVLGFSCRIPARAVIGGKDSGLINLLLVGTDSSQSTASRSDTLILCTICPEEKTVVITSFLRDLYVPIPGHGSNRLNAAHAFGGLELLEKTVQEDFDLYLDGCIEVDFANFSQIIDLLGGVTIDLRRDEARVINKKTDSHLSEGENHLNGDQALAYSRIRNLDRDGDFSRTNRQRKLLSSLMDSYRNANLLTILSVVVDALPMISTNLEKKQILKLTAKLFPLLEHADIRSQRIPADGHYRFQNIRKMEVIVADLDIIRDDLRESLLNSVQNSTK